MIKAAISEKTYLKNIENLFKEMKHFWEHQDKVSSLQITIQVSSFLNIFLQKYA